MPLATNPGSPAPGCSCPAPLWASLSADKLFPLGLRCFCLHIGLGRSRLWRVPRLLLLRCLISASVNTCYGHSSGRGFRGLQLAPIPPLVLPSQHSAAIRQFQVDCGLDLKERDEKCCRMGCSSPTPLHFKERTSELKRQQRRSTKIKLSLRLCR